MKKIARPRPNQKGFSLTEMLIVVAVLAVLVAGIVAATGDVFTGDKTQRFARDLSKLSMDIKTLYNKSPDYGTLTNQVAEDAGVVPKDMLTGAAGAHQGPWGGAITIQPATVTAANDHMEIIVAGIPQAACAKLVATTAEGFSWMDLNGTVEKATPNAVIDPAVVSANCAAAGDANVVTYRLR